MVSAPSQVRVAGTTCPGGVGEAFWDQLRQNAKGRNSGTSVWRYVSQRGSLGTRRAASWLVTGKCLGSETGAGGGGIFHFFLQSPSVE